VEAEKNANKSRNSIGAGVHVTKFNRRSKQDSFDFGAEADEPIAGRPTLKAREALVAKRLKHSLKSALYRLIDKISRYLTRRMLEPPAHMLAIHGLNAYSIWGSKPGSTKVSQEMWSRIRKVFLRKLENFPTAVRKALHCGRSPRCGIFTCIRNCWLCYCCD
jgi:hypothetical protein